MKQALQLTKVIWILPLRIFLGYSWLSDGIQKIRNDWLSSVMLIGKATEADSSATITVEGAKLCRVITNSSPIWFQNIAERTILPNSVTFQVLLVFIEIITGIMLISGTFTFAAGLTSLGLIIIFLISSGIFEATMWYIPASICMLGGAGRAFGIDYFLMPYLNMLIQRIITSRKNSRLKQK